MKTNKISAARRNMVSKSILAMFVNNEINTQEDVNIIMIGLMKNLAMTRTEAANFFRESIGADRL